MTQMVENRVSLTTIAIPAQVKMQVLEIDPLAKVVLFGSRARGDFQADSDWDFLIVLNQIITAALKNDIRDQLYELELATGAVISARIHEQAEWEKRAVMPLYQNIQREGIIIWLDADYEGFVQLDSNEIEPLLKKVARLIAHIESLL